MACETTYNRKLLISTHTKDPDKKYGFIIPWIFHKDNHLNLNYHHNSLNALRNVCRKVMYQLFIYL